jgi:hypothetical protein
LGCTSPSLAADQFDLLCVGQLKQGTSSKASPHRQTYRIDLTGNRWCVAPCTQTSTIYSATASMLTLMEGTDSSKSSDGSALTHEIDRTTGALFDFRYSPPLFASSLPSWWEFRATCEPQPFSGMPAPKF